MKKNNTAFVEILDSDIATIEALHDLLLDNHEYSLDFIRLKKARELTRKMYNAFEHDPRSIDILNLNSRARNCLKSQGIKTIGQLLNTDRRSLIRIRNLGKQGITIINEALKDAGIITEPFLTYRE